MWCVGVVIVIVIFIGIFRVIVVVIFIAIFIVIVMVVPDEFATLGYPRCPIKQ